jgi:ribonuclease HI
MPLTLCYYLDENQAKIYANSIVCILDSSNTLCLDCKTTNITSNTMLNVVKSNIIIYNCHLMSSTLVDCIRTIANKESFNIYCFGLKVNKFNKCFKSIIRSIELADDVICIHSCCNNCQYKNAIMYTKNEKDSIIYLCSKCQNINKNKEKILIQFDGGKRKDKVGIGVVFSSCEFDSENDIIVPSTVLLRIHGRISNEKTSNEAEYKACQIAIDEALKRNYTNVEIQGDSELVIKQLNSIYKCKDSKLQPFHTYITSKIKLFESIKFVHVWRGNNSMADSLATKGLKLNDHIIITE